MKKYPSSKSLFFVPLLWSIVLGIVFLPFILENENGKEMPIAVHVFLTIIAAFLIWMLLDTNYRIEGNNVWYYSGPIRGKIDIRKISKIEHEKSLFVSSLLKPSLGLYGLTVTYNTYDTIYISPKNKEDFISELLKINPDIQTIN